MITLKLIFKILTPLERRRLTQVLFLFLGLAMLEVVGLASLMPFLAVIGNPDLIDTNPILSEMWFIAQQWNIVTKDKFLITLGWIAFFFIMFAAIYRGFAQYISNNFIEMCRHGISKRVLETFLHQPYNFFLDRHSGDLSKTILSEVDNAIERVVRPVLLMFVYTIVLISIVVLLFLVNPILMLLSLTMIGLLYAFIYFVLRNHVARFGRVVVESNAKRFTAASEALGGIKSIKLLGRETAYLQLFNDPSMQYSKAHAGHNTLGILPSYLVEVVLFGAVLTLTLSLVISSGSIQSVVMGEMLPIIGIYSLSAIRMKPVMNAIYQGIAGLRFGKALITNLYKELSLGRSEHINDDFMEPLGLKKEIFLDNLTFTYPSAKEPSLKGLSLKIPAKSSLGIVGTTGAGKTTLVDLILGLLQPSKGQLKVDGETITDLNLRSWQKSLGYVPQEIFLSNSTVAENIAFGIPINEIDAEQVSHCAKLAQLDEFVKEQLPKKYKTMVGERGVKLSGGQRQRIGIARALYHNPEIIIFDEATSALDIVTEKAVMDAIENLANEITVILIAHRLSTVRHCDRILLLDRGRVKSCGTFDQLNVINAHFRQLAGS